jgi:hypothetical protein
LNVCAYEGIYCRYVDNGQPYVRSWGGPASQSCWRRHVRITGKRRCGPFVPVAGHQPAECHGSAVSRGPTGTLLGIAVLSRLRSDAPSRRRSTTRRRWWAADCCSCWRSYGSSRKRRFACAKHVGAEHVAIERHGACDIFLGELGRDISQSTSSYSWAVWRSCSRLDVRTSHISWRFGTPIAAVTYETRHPLDRNRSIQRTARSRASDARSGIWAIGSLFCSSLLRGHSERRSCRSRKCSRAAPGIGRGKVAEAAIQRSQSGTFLVVVQTSSHQAAV